MQRLVQTIESVREKLPLLRRQNLKETPTRTIVIDPLLEALGWNVRDLDEVQLEYPTVDGKSVDYALKLNNKPVLLVEAKALNDPLDDVKGITQTVSYAANDGVEWCVLTNGVKWRIYRSVEKCAAPDKLLFEVNLDPEAGEEMTSPQIAQQMWHLSRDEMARGTLDVLGEQTFTDGKVRKALQSLMASPPRQFLNLVRKEINDESLAPRRIKESLRRIAGEAGTKVGEQRKAKKGESPYDEAHHLAGRPQEVGSLFRALDRLCLAFAPSGVSRRYLAKTVNYEYGNQGFLSVSVLRSGLRVWLRLKYVELENPPPFARDVSRVGHWGVGDLELRICNHDELAQAEELIRRSFETVSQS